MMAIPQPSPYALADLRRRLGLRPRKPRQRRRPPVWQYPRAIEAKYATFLAGIVNHLASVTKAALPSIERIVAERDQENRLDAWTESLDTVLEALKLKFGIAISPSKLNTYLADVGQKTSKWNDAQWQNSLKAMLGVDVYSPERFLASHIKAFVNENATLITKLTEGTYHDVAQVLTAGIRRGDRVETIKKELLSWSDLESGRFRKAETRARLIARDQIGKLNGELTMNRQTALGITEYTWRTSMDERVRGNPSGLYPKSDPSHYDREGKVYKWASPPEGGHPGEAIQCRCWAEPIFDEEELAGEPEPAEPQPEGAPAPEVEPPSPAPAEPEPVLETKADYMADLVRLGLPFVEQGGNVVDLEVLQDVHSVVKDYLRYAPEHNYVERFAYGHIDSRPNSTTIAHYDKNRREIKINSTWAGSRANRTASQIRSDNSGFHPKGTNVVRGYLTHEVGHDHHMSNIDHVAYRKVTKQFVKAAGEYSYKKPDGFYTNKAFTQSEILKLVEHTVKGRLTTEERWQWEQLTNSIKANGSGYVKEALEGVTYGKSLGNFTQALQEFAAELWAEYRVAPRPRPLARRVGRIMERSLMERMVRIHPEKVAATKASLRKEYRAKMQRARRAAKKGL